MSRPVSTSQIDRVAAASGEGDETAQVNAAAELVIQPSHSVAKAATRPSDPFTEVGTTGLRQFGGYVLEEWLQQLAGRKAAWVWREMMDNDPIIGAILFCIRWMAQSVEWRVDEGGDGAAAELVESCMHDMDISWGDTISEILSFLPYGWALCEEVYKRRQGPQDEPDWQKVMNGAYTSEDDSWAASSRYKDGKVGWRKFGIRAQETLLRWHFDGYSTPVAMEQVDWHGGNHTIPLSKALLFRTQTTRNNPEGRSILRNAVTSYWSIKNAKALEGIGMERDLAGVPVAKPPPGVDLFSAGNAQLLAKVQRMVTALRNDEYSGIVLPSHDWELELMSTGGSRQFDTDKVIRRYRQDMAMSMLSEFVLIGSDAVGSYALAEVKSESFGIALDGILDLVCEVFNRFAIPRLLKLNGMDVTDPPKIAHGSARKIDLDRIGSFLQAISLAGAPIPWSVELLKALFADAGLPTNFEEQKDRASDLPTAPEQPAQLDPSKDPAANPANELSSERAEAEQQRAAMVQKAVLSKAETHNGAMVALYPHPDVATAIAQAGGEPADALHVTLAYLGDASSITNPDALRHTVARWAANTPPLIGQLSGVGRFTAGPEPVTYASADLPDLPEHRQRLIGHLEAADAPASRQHGFTPHVTLAYGRNNVTPVVAHHSLRFDHASLVISGQRHDFQLTGKPRPTVRKAEHRTVPQGTVIDVASRLNQRQMVLTGQLEAEMRAALTELGEHAATAFQSIATKAANGPTPSSVHRIVARVLKALNLQSWIDTTLRPVLRNHAGRVTADTVRTIKTEIGLEVGVTERHAQSIAATAGQELGMRDIEPQVRAAILKAVRDGLTAGDSPSRTAQRIRDQVPAGRFVNAGSRYRAQLISKEETRRMQRAASLAAYDSNDHITHVEVRDGIYGPPRSDEHCVARDGDLVAKDQAGSVHPDHIGCTLSFSPVVSPSVSVREPALAA